MKLCKKCGETFGGLRCRPCENKAAAIYREKNKEKMAIASKKWQKENPEKYKKSLSNYAEKNKKVIKEKRFAKDSVNRVAINLIKNIWHRKNATRINEIRRIKYRENPGKFKQDASNWRIKNPEKYALADRKWRIENRIKVLGYKAKWYSRNKSMCKVFVQNRRARIKNSGGSLSKNIVSRLMVRQKKKCACCKEPLGDDFHIDHIMPLALGGANSDFNVQLLRAKCNLQKGAKHPVEFMQQRGYLL